MKKQMIVLMAVAVLLSGCGKGSVSQEEYGETVEERNQSKEQSEALTQSTDIEGTNGSETESHINIISNKNYQIDGQELKIGMYESDGKIRMSVDGNVDTEQKAALMLTVFFSSLEEVEGLLDSYSINISFGDLMLYYLKSEESLYILGENRDGSFSITFPDWFPSEITMEESEVNEYASEILAAIKDFGESSSWNAEIKNDVENNDTEGANGMEDNKPLEESGSKTEDTVTTGMRNALKKAKRYLSTSAFSYEGLIEQLEYEKYSHEEAVYAADNCGADWNEQALESSKKFLSVMPFSYDGLVSQLEFNKFTEEQAKYAADNCGADWNEQAARSAKKYINIMEFSKDGLIEQLEYDGFTHEQAVYGVEKNWS